MDMSVLTTATYSRVDERGPPLQGHRSHKAAPPPTRGPGMNPGVKEHDKAAPPPWPTYRNLIHGNNAGKSNWPRKSSPHEAQ